MQTKTTNIDAAASAAADAASIAAAGTPQKPPPAVLSPTTAAPPSSSSAAAAPGSCAVAVEAGRPPPYRMPPPAAPDAPPPAPLQQLQAPPPVQQQQQLQQQLHQQQQPPPPAQPPPPIPGTAPDAQGAALRAHSSKFPIERAVVLTSGDKNCKIPILHEYSRRPLPAPAPVPAPAAAWPPPRPQGAAAAGAAGAAAGAAARGAYARPAHVVPSDTFGNGTDRTGGRAFPARTYHTIKDIISSRFGPASPSAASNPSSVACNPSSSGVSTGPPQLNNHGDPQHFGADPVSRTMGYQPQTSTPQGYQPQQSAQQGYQPQSTPQGYQPPSRSEYAAPYALTPQSQNPSGARTALEQAGVYMVMRQPPQHHQQQHQPQHQPSHQQQLHQQHQVQQHQILHQQQLQSQHYATQGLQGLQSPWTSRPQGPPPQGPPPQAPLQGTRPPSPETVPPSTPATQPPTTQGVGAPAGELTGSGAPGDRISSKDRPDGATTTEGDTGVRPASQAGPSSGHSSECEKGLRSSGRSSCNVDSGRGSANCSSGGGTTGGTAGPVGGRSRRTRPCSPPAPRPAPLHDRGEWVDAVENELRAILSPGAGGGTGAASTGTGGGGRSSESLSSLSPPLPPLGASPPASPRAPRPLLPRSLGARVPAAGAESSVLKGRGPLMALPGVGAPKHRALKHALSAGALGDSGADATSSTWTGLEDEDVSSDGGRCDARALRRQLTALERMYAEVLALLGGGGGGGRRALAADRRKAHGGSLSSLPSSASSLRPLHRERRRDDRRKARDLKGVGRRFQRLEAHVVTLARSVAHLSSEMRTQHLVMQEMESIRSELASLRVGGPPATAVPAPICALPIAGPPAVAGPGGTAGVDALGDPARLRRLTKFFGDEPPLLRLFLQRLGYERYAGALEAERVGLLELPFVGDERLQRLGIPLGPRARILAEAQRTLGPAAAAAHGPTGGHGASSTLPSAADKVVPAPVVAAGGVGPKVVAAVGGACIRSDQFYSDH